MVKPLLNDDKDALQAAAGIQQESKDALTRLEQTLQETEEQGLMTLDDLYAQRRQLDGIEADGERLHDQLDETEYLQSKLGTWFGKKKKKFIGKNKSKDKDTDGPMEKENSKNQEAAAGTKKKGRWRFGKSSKKSVEEDPTIPVSVGSLDREVALYKGEHKEDMKALADGDKEIDDQMDRIGNQLGNLLNMAQEIGTETKAHGQRIENVDKLMADAQERQDKANKKAKKFLGFNRNNNKDNEKSVAQTMVEQSLK